MTPQEEIGIIERAKASGRCMEAYFNMVFGFIFKRATSIANRIKSHISYTVADGENLGLV